MNKILLIIRREYMTRVKKKSFIVMTILGPLLMAGLMITPLWLAMQKPDKQMIEVIDDSGLLENAIAPNEFLTFDYPSTSLSKAKANFYATDYSAILWIPPLVIDGKTEMKLFFKKEPGIATKQYIQKTVEKVLFDMKLRVNNINSDVIKSAQVSVPVTTISLEVDGKGKETQTEVNMYIGWAAGILIYFFIFLYGVQVMRGVMEEKTSRIVEVMLSSVKPFQLMMGKIVGIALVGLTQFLLWVILTAILSTVISGTLLKDFDMKQVLKKEQITNIGARLDVDQMQAMSKNNNTGMSKEMEAKIKAFFEKDFLAILLCFLFYFLGGYLLYSALFAAVGSAVDNEADTQQFMLPITIPLIFSFIIAQAVILDPAGPMAFWFSIIPFTSPIVMMVRLPFGVPPSELWLSMGLLVLGFLATTWLAGRIYRTGILMYGKKVTYRELGKWLFYKG